MPSQRRYTPCSHIFKSYECGHKGEETRCDKSLDDCRRFDNLMHFNGIPTVGELTPDVIAERERCIRIIRNGCGDSIIEEGLIESIINGDPE